VHDFLLIAAVATCLLGLLFALTSASVVGGARELQPLQVREFSGKRSRRQTQFGAVALGGFIVGETARFFGERKHIAALEILAAGTLLVVFVALGALLWSTTWVYGDEAKSS
jgi:hypothetical protein